MKVLLILLGIFKWAGIVLLTLLLLLLLIVLVVLLSPIRYRLSGKKQEAVGGSFDVSWLFGAIKIKGAYGAEEKTKLLVKVLWFTLVDTEKKQAEDAEARKAVAGKKASPKKKADRQEMPKQEPVLQTAEKQPEGKKEAAEEEKKPKARPQAQRMAEKRPKTVRRVQLSEITELPPEEIDDSEEIFFSDEVEEKKKKGLPPIVGMLWSIEEKKEIFRAFGKLLKRLFRGVLPGDLFLKAVVGTGDPATTGYVLAAAGVLTAKFGDAIQIKGDFTKAALEDIELRVKGKIVLGVLLWAVLAFILTKPVRKAICKMIRFLRGKEV